MSGATGYNVYIDGNKVNTSPVTGTSYNVTGETAGTTYNVTVTAVNAGVESLKSMADSVTTRPQVSVTPLLVATTSAWGGQYGVPYNALQLYAEGEVFPYRWSVVSGQLPSGLTLSTDGVISGTPTGSNGTSSFVVQVTGANGQVATRALSIAISGTPPLSVTTKSLPSSKVGANYSAQLDGIGAGPYKWTVVSGQLPAGLTLNATGHLNGVPTKGGSYIFNVQLSNGAGKVATKQFTLTVTGLPHNERLVLWNGQKRIVPALVHQGTTYVPIWYVMQLLKPMGIDSAWNGTLWHMTTTQTVDLTNISAGHGTSGIYMNGTLVQNVTPIVAEDVWSHKPTTYMPIWYVMKVLKRLGLHSAWNGTTWTLTK